MPIIYRCDRCGKESKTYDRHQFPHNLVLCDGCDKKFKLGYDALRIKHAAEHEKFKENFVKGK